MLEAAKRVLERKLEGACKEREKERDSAGEAELHVASGWIVTRANECRRRANRNRLLFELTVAGGARDDVVLCNKLGKQ